MGGTGRCCVKETKIILFWEGRGVEGGEGGRDGDGEGGEGGRREGCLGFL